VNASAVRGAVVLQRWRIGRASRRSCRTVRRKRDDGPGRMGRTRAQPNRPARRWGSGHGIVTLALPPCPGSTRRCGPRDGRISSSSRPRRDPAQAPAAAIRAAPTSAIIRPLPRNADANPTLKARIGAPVTESRWGVRSVMPYKYRATMRCQMERANPPLPRLDRRARKSAATRVVRAPGPCP